MMIHGAGIGNSLMMIIMMKMRIKKIKTMIIIGNNGKMIIGDTMIKIKLNKIQIIKVLGGKTGRTKHKKIRERTTGGMMTIGMMLIGMNQIMKIRKTNKINKISRINQINQINQINKINKISIKH